jgi:hypothetical protein
LQLGVDSYNDLRAAFERAKKFFFSDVDSFIQLPDFFKSVKRGSKKFRIILSMTKIKLATGRCPITKFAETVSLPAPDPHIAAKLNGRWHKNFYLSDMRTFLFKLHHNTLGVNSRVHHYNPDRAPICTFCNIARFYPAERETVPHIFWHCPQTSKSINHLFLNYLNFTVSIENFFTGTDREGNYHECLMNYECY